MKCLFQNDLHLGKGICPVQVSSVDTSRTPRRSGQGWSRPRDLFRKINVQRASQGTFLAAYVHGPKRKRAWPAR